MASFRLSTTFLVFSTIIAALAPADSSRADFIPGRDAYLRGDYAEALALFLPPALQGDAKSQIGLGLLYARGHGTEQDIVRSYSWFDMAAAQAENEHIVVRILARTNRDYLAKRMSDDDIAKARLWSTMARTRAKRLYAPPSRTAMPNSRGFSGLAVTIPNRGREPANPARRARTPSTPKPSYGIQLAALRQGKAKELRAIWKRLSKRHKLLSKLSPVLVRMDLGASGVYEGLRAGPFEDARSAYRVCAGLIAEKQDCFVVTR